ncbi:PREDICTED: pentatricopeptide repeat-containing protein At4g02820, mitochondrial [Tarenaya hassleriana]|uniref:pentatricopeptide repeat-containing protein At4g02820, mitochondrial n=1 Tax=Tarenaya hassleriana TaxID=28532 RepID=UPI00053CA6A4|nr:PREDICTED: pentatricopeptide repeat-containing protein At4g02820, mitochondrial [Tarenaya hassleriana]
MLLRSARAATLASIRRLSTAASETAAGNPVKPHGDGGVGGGGGGGRRDTLGGRLLGLVYRKRSAVVAIRKWKEEGRTVRKYELNRIVRELRKLKRYKHALEICEWMVLQEDIKLQPGDYAVHLDLITKIRGLNSAEKFFEDIPDRMRDHSVCTSLLHTYVQSKLSDKAEALFEKMSECGFLKSPLPYNHLISMYISKGQLDKVPVLIQELKKNVTPDIVTYNLWLTALASENDVEAVEKVYLKLKQAKLDPDWVTFSVLANLYTKNDCLEKAKLALKEMEKLVSKKNRVAYASLISLYGNIGDKDGVNQTWKRMRSCFRKMNDAEYLSKISALVKLGQFAEAKDIYDEWESVSGTGDARIPNLILAEHMNRGEMHLGETFFQRVVEKGISPSYSTWEILTWAYLKHKDLDKVLDCFKKAIGSVKEWTPNLRLVREVCKELEDQGNVEGAEELLNVLRKAGYTNTQLYNSLLRTYAKAGKMALIVEERMAKDNIELDEETHDLMRLTSRMCVA